MHSSPEIGPVQQFLCHAGTLWAKTWEVPYEPLFDHVKRRMLAMTLVARDVEETRDDTVLNGKG